MEQSALDYIWDRQRSFNKHFQNLGSLSEEEKIRLTKDFILYAKGELIELVENLNWKEHRRTGEELKRSNIKIELVDIFKYWNGLALIWDLEPAEFVEAWTRKTEVVEQRYRQEFDLVWDPKKYSKCTVFDIDDTLADYWREFVLFIKARAGKKLRDPKPGESVTDWAGRLLGYDLALKLKHEWREGGMYDYLPIIPGAADFVNKVYDANHYIIIMSARPYDQYERIMSDTIRWLKRNAIPYHTIVWGENKAEKIIKDFPYVDYVFEDDLVNAQRIAEKGKKVYLRRTPYNSDTVSIDATVWLFKDYSQFNVKKGGIWLK